jgi:hypothetical protein
MRDPLIGLAAHLVVCGPGSHRDIGRHANGRAHNHGKRHGKHHGSAHARGRGRLPGDIL